MRTRNRLLYRCLRRGAVAASVLALAGTIFLAPAGRAQPSAASPGGAPGFRLDLRPQYDDIFGDAAEYRRTLDRFAELTGTMRRVCDDFARSVQEALTEVGAAEPGKKRTCPGRVRAPYLRAYGLGQDYLRTGRELLRHYELVKDLDRLGDNAALTPDYRRRVGQALKDYETLLAGYREMKATFYEQLGDELRFAGCDPAQLLQPAGPEEIAGSPVAASAGAAKAAPAAERERPGAGILFYVDNSRCRRGHHVFVDGQPLGEVSGAARSMFHSTAGPHELCLLTQGTGPTAAPPFGTSGGGGTAGSGGTRVASAGPAVLTLPRAVPPPGLPREESSPQERQCGDPGTIRKSYLHEGWTIALRCE